MALAAFPPRRRCAITGPLLDELLLATFLGPLLTANLRAPPCLTLFSTNASLSGARACSSTVSFEQWTKLYDLSEERGELVCLDWCACPPVDTDPRDGRASAFFTTVELPWEEFFSYRFRTPRHINVLELEALISLVQRLVDRGAAPVRLLVLVDSRVVLGAVSKGRSSSRKVNFQLRRFLVGCFSVLTCPWIWYGCPAGPTRRMYHLGVPQLDAGANSYLGSLFPNLRRKCSRLPPSANSSCFSSHCQNLLKVHCVDALRHSSPTCTRQVTGMLASVAIAYRQGCGKASRTCGWSPASRDRSPETFVATAHSPKSLFRVYI